MSNYFRTANAMDICCKPGNPCCDDVFGSRAKFARAQVRAAQAQRGLGGFWDTVKDIGKGTFNVVASGEQAKGAAAALQAQQQANIMGMQAGGGGIMGFQPMTLLLLGGVGIGAYLLLRKKKPAPTTP